MTDDVRYLPLDNSKSQIPVNPSDLEFLSTVFKTVEINKEELGETCSKLYKNNNIVLFATALFILVNFSDDFIKKIYKNSENRVVMIIIKSIVFLLLLFVVKNYYLIRA